jgi:DNA-binding beta-propeller fold protein YncE
MGGPALGVLVLETDPELQYKDVSDIAVDSADNVYLLTRHPGAVVVHGPDGRLIRRWGIDRFVLPHGITIDQRDRVYIVDQGEHAVRVFTAKGDEITLIGTPGVPSDTGVDWSLPTYKERYLSTTRGGPPFNNPTKVALAADGTFYVSDGYGNARVHRFGTEGEFLRSWGEPGSEPGQFRLVHNVLVADDGRVLVSDRENDRVQCFDPDGAVVAIWGSVRRPAAVAAGPGGTFIVAELGWKVGDHSFATGPVTTPVPPGIAIVDGDGALIERLAQPDGAPPLLWRPHGLGVSPHTGRVYVAQLGAPGASHVTTVTTLG